jgi:hypothetical protein
MVTLPVAAVMARQPLRAGEVFNAFCGHRQAQFVAHVDQA